MRIVISTLFLVINKIVSELNPPMNVPYYKH